MARKPRKVVIQITDEMLETAEQVIYDSLAHVDLPWSQMNPDWSKLLAEDVILAVLRVAGIETRKDQ